MTLDDPLILLLTKLALIGFMLFGALLLWRGLRWYKLSIERDELRAEVRRLQTEWEKSIATATATASDNNSGHLDYLLGELKHSQFRLGELSRTDIQHAALDMRRRALQAEWQACEAGQRRDYALPVVLPAYIGIGKDLLAAAAKRQQLLKEKCQRSEAELERLAQLESTQHELTQALQLLLQGCSRLSAQLALQTDAPQVQELEDALQEMQRLLLSSERSNAQRYSPDLAQTIEQGQQLDAAFHQGSRELVQLRHSLLMQRAEGSERDSKIEQLQQRIKQSERQLREASDCVDTLEKSLDEASGLLKKLLERSKRFQEQDSRLAILDARAKQAEKEVRAWQQLHKELESRMQSAKPATRSDEYTNMLAEMQDQAARLERLRYENLMLEEQVLDMDRWRDRAEHAESELCRAMDEKRMLEQQILYWSDEDSLLRTEANLERQQLLQKK